MTEFAPQALPPALPLGEVQTQYLARIAAGVERLVAIAEGGGSSQAETVTPEAGSRDVTKARVKAREFIEDLLRFQGPQPWTEVVRRGRGYGNSEKTLERVRHSVAYVKKVDGRWLWHLKNDIGMEETT